MIAPVYAKMAARAEYRHRCSRFVSLGASARGRRWAMTGDGADPKRAMHSRALAPWGMQGYAKGSAVLAREATCPRKPQARTVLPPEQQALSKLLSQQDSDFPFS